MRLPIDIIIAPHDHFDRILADIENVEKLAVTKDAGVSIDDVVTIIAMTRNAIDDRKAWWKIRREVYGHFASHSDIPARTLAMLPDTVRDQVPELDGVEINTICESWLAQDDATPTSLEQAIESLTLLINACSAARAESNGVFLRTNQPPNAFEAAFRKLEGKQLANFKRAFDGWDAIKRHEAHQRYNYYRKEGIDDCLNLVLRDFTRRKTTKVNLKSDQRILRRHIKDRVKRYRKSPQPEFGDPDDPIKMITLTFDIEYEGFADLSFDTRPNADVDLRWPERTDQCLEFYHWYEGGERFGCDELPLKMTLHDGSKIELPPNADTDIYETHIGEMLKDTLLEARGAGEFAKLPLAENCCMWVGGTHTNYNWPEDEELHKQGRVN